VRALVVDGAERVLLVRFRPPEGEAFWTTPGGGVGRIPAAPYDVGV
jgi:ADP-ribose pyrophosphatase YjhB (NUDIX family)